MTIEELLMIARQNVNQANRMHDATSAAIAQAAALTAQTMIMREQQQDIAANNERAELRELWRQ